MGYVYNGVTIADVQTTQFETVMEKDPSGSDAMWSKYTIKVRGFLTTVVDPQLGTVSLTNNTSTVLRIVKDLLSVPRRAMSYAVGGTTLVSVTPAAAGAGIAGIALPAGLALDARYGPEPLPVNVYQVTSGCYMVECGCVVRQVICDEDHCSRANIFFNSPIVSLKWTQTESFDENWYSHLVTTGKLIVRTDFFRSADSFRALTVPVLLKDYVRVNSQYTLSADGTTLDFSFDDRERDRLPPAPATKATGSMTVVVKAGAKRTGTVRVHLEGPKGTSRKLLMLRALQMCYSKLNPEWLSINPAGTISNPVVNLTLTEDFFDPVVDVEMSSLLSNVVSGGVWEQPDGTAKMVSTPVAFPSVGTVPTGCADGRDGIKPADRKRIMGLLASAFSDPCCR